MPYDRRPWEERSAQAKEAREEGSKLVLCKGLVYLHHKGGGVLVKEGEDLAGSNWRQDGKETWLPKSQVRCEPHWNMLDRGDPIEVSMPRWLADEKEMYYE